MARHCDRLREALSIRNIRPSMLAYKTGISEASISHYLAGHYEPKSQKMQILAKALHVSPAWLSGLDVPMTEDGDLPPTEELVILSDGEKVMLDLFRSAGPYQQAIIIKMIEAALSTKPQG